MSVFIDTGVFYAQHDRDATRHRVASEAFDEILTGRYGRLYSSESILDETVTLTRSRTGRFRDAKAVQDRILGAASYPDVIDVLHVSEERFAATLAVFERYRDHPLSFTDSATIALVEEHDIDHLLSFDDDFDGIVDRLDPASLA